ncbi:MAG: hypothetical protein ACOYKA_05795, partial [Legionellaceae bacterium]
MVAFTDSADFLKVLHLLPSTFRAASGNFELVLGFLKHYHLESLPLAYGVYTLIILWALLIAGAHWRAVISFFKDHSQYVHQATFAFFLNTSMVGSFLVLDEVFIQYEAGHSHIVRFGVILI